MSESSAMTTIAVTQSATVTSRSRRPARGTREEDDAIGGARDLLERPDELSLAASGLAGHRHGRPHALVKLAAELLHEALGILGDVWIALGDQLLTMPRTHAQELHRRRLWQRPTGCPTAAEPGTSPLGQTEDVARPGTRAEAPDAVPDRLAGDPLR